MGHLEEKEKEEQEYVFTLPLQKKARDINSRWMGEEGGKG